MRVNNKHDFHFANAGDTIVLSRQLLSGRKVNFELMCDYVGADVTYWMTTSTPPLNLTGKELFADIEAGELSIVPEEE